MNRILFLADDLSGANDVGCQIFKNGYKCASVDTAAGNFSKFSGTFKGITVLNTASRLLTPRRAYKTVFSTIVSAGKNILLYKKIDSTLRGNIGSEIDACIDALNIKAAALVPAYPKLGRKIKNGKLYLNGRLLEETEYANDPANPALTSDIALLLKKQSKYKTIKVPIALIRQGKQALADYIRTRKSKTPVIFIFDCLTEQDLKTIAEAVKNFKLIAGAAALAGYILPKKAKSAPFCPVVTGATAYLVGSVKQITHKQIEILSQAKKIPVFPVLKNKLAKAVGRDIIFKVKPLLGPGREKTRRKIATSFKNIAAGLVKNNNYSRFFISGGATAETIMKALKISYTEIRDVIVPGVPLTFSPEKNIYIVTKPGGFGKANTLLKIYKRLKHTLAK